MKRTPLRPSRKRIPARSRKTAAIYAGPTGRAAFVAWMLEKYPRCMNCATLGADTVHEVLSRARGGKMLPTDAAIAQGQRFVTLHVVCHNRITDRPAESATLGWSISRGGTSTRGIAAADLMDWSKR